MENIRTHMDKIMDKFNESVTHTAPKKLFENLNNTSFLNDSGGVAKKRRISDTINGSHVSQANSETSFTSSLMAPQSPWETRRIKVDLVESKSRINKLKQEIERQHKMHADKEELLESRVRELTKQSAFSASKIADMEKHMQQLRKREQAAKLEMFRVQKESAQLKASHEELVLKLEKEKHEITQNAQLCESNLNTQLSDLKKKSEKLSFELGLVTEELVSVKAVLEEAKANAAERDRLKSRCEQNEQELEMANSRIKELEYEISTYKDWKEITENSQVRLSSIPEITQELERLKAKNHTLNGLIGEKLLLEEQVHDLRSRLEKEEGGRSEAIALQVKLSHVEQELKEYVKVAQDHCPPNTIASPMMLRARLEDLLEKDIVNAAESASKVSDKRVRESEMVEYKQKCEIYARNIEELNIALKKHKTFKDRVQKKLLLVSRERDCYKQLLDNFEKDLTISNATSVSNATATEISNAELQLRSRIEMLERTLIGYKEICANLEKEIKSTNGQVIETNLSSDSYEHFRSEINKLRMENEQLRKRKAELELELEHRLLKDDFNMGGYKVVHLKMNPASQAYEQAENLVEKLQAEIERLKRRNQQLQEHNEATQTRLNETTNMTMNIKELNQLRAELESTNSKMKKMKECYKAATMEFREVCYLLFGYSIDHVGASTNYKLRSMYAESEDDYLNFRLNEENLLELLETPYSETLQSMIETHLGGNKSLPTFLSALTLELFERNTTTIS